MKKLLFLLSFGLMSTGIFAADGKPTAADFAIDNQEITAEMAALTTAEAYVNAHPNATFDEVKTANGLNLSTDFANSLGTEPPYGIPSFAWGFCLGFIGLAAVYILTDNDKGEVKKALFGALAVIGVTIILYVVTLGLSLGAVAL